MTFEPCFFSVAGPSSSLSTMTLLAKNAPSRSEMIKVQQQVKVNSASMTVLRREMQEVRVKQLEQQKQLQDQEQKLLEQTQVIGEQNARLAELEHKLRELMESAVGASTTRAMPTASSTSATSSSGAAVAVASTSSVGLSTTAAIMVGDGGISLKRRHKNSDLPRHSKRLRSKK